MANTPGVNASKQDIRHSARYAIMEAAAQAFEKQGFQATTLDDIAQAAGVARRTIYLHFNSKKDILIAACIEQAHMFLEEVKANVTHHGDFPTFVLDCLVYVIERSPSSKFFMLKVSEGTGIDPVALYFKNQEFVTSWIEFFQESYDAAIIGRQLNPDVKLDNLVNWFGRISTSYLQYPLEGENSQDIRESLKVLFLSALRFNAYQKL